MKRTLWLLLWWSPALVLAAVAGGMPDGFLDSPYTTIPHEAAFVLRVWIIVSAFGYVTLVVAIRGAIYLGKRKVGGEGRQTHGTSSVGVGGADSFSSPR